MKTRWYKDAVVYQIIRAAFWIPTAMASVI